jgi:hypothetical protein
MTNTKDSGLFAAMQEQRDRVLTETSRALDLYMRSPVFLMGLRCGLVAMNDLRRLVDRTFPGAWFVRAPLRKGDASQSSRSSESSKTSSVTAHLANDST